MRLATLAELVEAGVLELGALRVRGGQSLQRLALQPVEADAPDAGRRTAEKAAAEVAVEADGLEQARAAIARDVGDAHLGHHLQHAVLERAQQPALCLGRIGPVASDLVRGRQVRHGLQRQPRADDVRAVADQRRDHVRVARLVRLDEQRAPGAQAALDEALVRRRQREQGRDRGTCPAGRAVADADELRSFLHEPHAGVCDALDRGREELALVERGVHARRVERVQTGG